MRRTQIAFIVFLALAVAGLAAWRLLGQRAQVADGPILIGVLASLGTTPGDGIHHGVTMAVEELNAEGGVGGRPVEVRVVDVGGSTEATVRGYQSLAQDGAAAVIGVAGDSMFAVMDALPLFGVPLLCTGTGADRLTGMVADDPSRYRPFFRVMHASHELAEVTTAFATDYLHGELGLSRFALLTETGAWTDGIRARWEAALSGDGTEVVWSGSFSPGTEDFQPLFRAIQESSAEYILDASSLVDATLYLRQWATMQGPPIGAIPTGAGTRRYYRQIGPAGVSVCSVSTIPSEANPTTERSAAWWRAYVERFDDPEYTSAYSYDAVFILAEAITRAGGTEPGPLVEALEQTDHMGVAARWQFGPDHHPRYGDGFRTIPMIQYVEPGAEGYRVIWPRERAKGEFVWPGWGRR